MIYYVAYGSNLHPLRLRQRLGAVSPLARIRINGRRVLYRKRGQDGTGKCDLAPATTQSLGVLYALNEAQLARLDQFEGGYARITLPLMLGERSLEALTYQALPEFIDPALAPLDWYQQLVLAGCRALGFDTRYQEELVMRTSVADSDRARTGRMERLVAALDRHRIAALQHLPWGEA